MSGNQNSSARKSLFLRLNFLEIIYKFKIKEANKTMSAVTLAHSLNTDCDEFKPNLGVGSLFKSNTNAFEGQTFNPFKANESSMCTNSKEFKPCKPLNKE